MKSMASRSISAAMFVLRRRRSFSFSYPLIERCYNISTNSIVQRPPLPFVSRTLFHSFSKPEYVWHPAKQASSQPNNSQKPSVAAVLVGWVGSEQRHMREFAEWYTSRGIHAITVSVPPTDLLSYYLGRRAQQDTELLVQALDQWLNEDVENRNLIFHTLCAGWLVSIWLSKMAETNKKPGIGRTMSEQLEGVGKEVTAPMKRSAIGRSSSEQMDHEATKEVNMISRRSSKGSISRTVSETENGMTVIGRKSSLGRKMLSPRVSGHIPKWKSGQIRIEDELSNAFFEEVALSRASSASLGLSFSIAGPVMAPQHGDYGLINDYVKLASRNKVPLVRSLTLNWATFCIEMSNKAVVLKLHKDYVPICMECLNDGAPEVRDAAFTALAAIAKLVGMKPLERSLEKLDDVRRKKLSEMIGNTGSDQFPSAPSGTLRVLPNGCSSSSLEVSSSGYLFQLSFCEDRII